MHHMGMGDMINVSGAAVYLSRNYDQLNLPCHANYETSVRSMFSLHPKIRVFVLSYMDDLGLFPVIPEELGGDVLSTHWMLSGGMADPSLSRWENEYAALRVPYSERWDSCPIQGSSKQVAQVDIPDESYAFVHDDHSRDIKIREKYIPTRMRVIRPNPITPNILSYCALITHAAEGHYADSCFRHLAESIETKGRLYYHQYAKHWSPILGEPEGPSRKEWTTIRS